MKSSDVISETANDKVGSTVTKHVDIPTIGIIKKPDGMEVWPLRGLELFQKQMGTQDTEFLNGILRDLIATCTKDDGAVDERNLNFLVSIIRGAKPRDEIECLIALQMATLHSATMKFNRHFMNAGTTVEVDCLGAAYLKSARTFAIMADALRQRQCGDNPTVTVQNVSVSDGGQAIVGNVTPKAKGQSANAPTVKADTEAATESHALRNGTSAERVSRPN